MFLHTFGPLFIQIVKKMKKRKKGLRQPSFYFERFLTFGHISNVPQRQIAFGYLSYIIVGTMLLCLPFATRTNVPLIDNLFTITSAVSTTGLGTVPTAVAYTVFGQVVILLMIQLGGIGYMTLSSFVLFRMTHHFLRIKKGVMEVSFSMPQGVELKNMVHSIVAFTLVFETLGAMALYFSFLNLGVETPLWSAIFHSVSSFCTAGFSIYPDSLEAFKCNVSVNLIVSILSYAGAMGFIVMHDLWAKIRNFGYRITFTTRIIVLITIVMSMLGSAQLYFLEPSIQMYGPWDRAMIALFQTMSAMTTVGYNTVPLGLFSSISLILMVYVMMIGSSPSGTGGGIKSTTVSAVFAFVKSKLSFERDVRLAGHRLPTFRVDSALTILVFYTFILGLGSYLLIMVEDAAPVALLFEAASALGTVGLSTGITADLSSVSKMVLIFMMYIGRIGVLTFGSFMLIRLSKKASLKELTDEDIAV